MLAVIEECLKQSGKIELPEETVSAMEHDTLSITDEDSKRQILSALLPGVNVGFLVKSLDFVICERGVQDER